MTNKGHYPLVNQSSGSCYVLVLGNIKNIVQLKKESPGHCILRDITAVLKYTSNPLHPHIDHNSNSVRQTLLLLSCTAMHSTNMQVIQQLGEGVGGSSILGKGELSHLPPKFEHIFVAGITSPPPFFCADTFITSL